METNDLGRALRRWRDRIAPENVGIVAGGRRRASGLRREELAALAGISVDYLTRLEQGRASSPSVQVLEALARGLRLDDPARELLFRLAGQTAPGVGLIESRIPPSVQRLLDRLESNPVVVYDGLWNLLLANPAYDALMGSTTAWRGFERNAVWRNLTGASTRVVHAAGERDALVSDLVGDLRMTAARYPADDRVDDLVSELRRLDARFDERWDAPRLPHSGGGSRHKTIDHPQIGSITLDCDTLIVATDDLRIMVYSAEPGTADAERLALAIVLGGQTLVEEPGRRD